MSGKRILRRFSASISDLLSIQKRNQNDEMESFTSLHQAVQMGNTVMAKALLDSGVVWVDEEDSRGRTALHYAVQHSNTELASLLLANAANIDAVDFTGTTPSHFACQEGMTDSVNLLLYYKADLLAVDKNGKTPFDLACEYGKEKMVERILESGLSWRSLQNAGDSHRASALHLAARNGHAQICSKLIQCGWPMNRVTSQGTALHEAVSYGKVNVVRYLLYIGVDATLENASGQTAADVAKKYAARNPITSKEIRFLLKEVDNFVRARAVQDFNRVFSEQLSFAAGDDIWVIERDPTLSRWKGIVFGAKATSRSGYFPPSAVKIIDKPPAVIAMASRIGSCGGSLTAQQVPRQIKKVSVPIVPDIGSMKPQNAAQTSDGQSSSGYSSTQSFRAISSPTNSNDERNNYCGFSTLSMRPSVLHLPSSNAKVSPSNVCSSCCHDSTLTAGGKLSVCSMRPSSASGNNCLNASINAYPSTSSHNPARTHFTEQEDVHSGGCHRNSTGSSSSQGSSSGFESMKSGSSRGGSSGGAASASSSNSSFLAASSSCSAQGALMRGDSPQSRISVHSSSSGGSSSLTSSSVDALDDASCTHSYLCSTTEGTSINVADMLLKGVPEAEVLALWLDKLGHSEYLTLFLTQGYDLSTIARITPEDLIALGITQPLHRKLLIAEIHRWHITDSWPVAVPSGDLREWLALIGLPEYVELFESQGYYSMSEVQKLNWEDFEDVGIKKLGHLKRLGLAIKKMKDYRLGRLRKAEESARMVAVAPHHPRNAQAKPATPTLHHHQAPPPPAPSSSFHPMNRCAPDHYGTWNRSPRPFRITSEANLSSQKPTVQVYPHHRTSVHAEEIDEYGTQMERKSSGCLLADSDGNLMRLNLYSPARILSDEPYPPHCIAARQSSAPSSAILSVTDTTITSDTEDCPPPPAPLVCEGSIRLLRSAFRGSPGPAAPLEKRFASGGSSASSTEQIPFANDNCGTIRSREAPPQAVCTSLSQPGTPRRSVHNVFCDDMNIAKCYVVAGNGDVLNDIGCMLQNLTDELDAMLLPSQAVHGSVTAPQVAPSQPVSNSVAPA